MTLNPPRQHFAARVGEQNVFNPSGEVADASGSGGIGTPRARQVYDGGPKSSRDSFAIGVVSIDHDADGKRVAIAFAT